MAQLNCRTDTPTDHLKPKVYLFCRSLLRERHVESLIQAIQDCRDCDIFWSDEPVPAQEKQALLADMQLFILPVDFTLLAEPNEEIDSEIAFAISNHIPLLPVLMEPDLYPLYSRPHKFGELPCLRYCREADSFVPFRDALSLTFDSLLLSEDLQTAASANLRSFPANSLKDLLQGISAYYGINRKKDTSKGLKLMHKAAKAGNPDASILLLRIYAHGIGTPANRQLAFQFASRLVKNLETQEKIKLPEQLPGYFLDIAHLCAGTDRQDLTVQLVSKLADSLSCTLGENHRLTVLYRDVLTTYCLRYRGDDFWLIDLCNKQYWAAHEAYGEIHPETLERARRVAYFSQKSGALHDALDHCKSIYAVCRKAFGEQAEETLLALKDVAAQCLRMSQFHHAQELGELAYKQLLETLGRHHPATLDALEIRCDAQLALDEARMVMPSLRQLHSGSRIVFGKEHPRSLQILVKMASAAMKLKQKVRAVRHITEAYKGYLHLYGSEYPKTLEIKEVMEYMKRISDEEDT